MSPAAPQSHGRAVLLLVLGVLLITVCAAVYLYVAQRGGLDAPETVTTEEQADRLNAEARRLVTLLTLLLISALLILLFVIGAYLVIRVGQSVVRERVGGKTTAYVDVWGSYRLTDAQIDAATAEDKPGDGPGGSLPEPGEPPLGPPPDPSLPGS